MRLFQDESNKFSNVKSAEKDKLNPLIYQVDRILRFNFTFSSFLEHQLIELQTEFPENGQLEIEAYLPKI